MRIKTIIFLSISIALALFASTIYQYQSNQDHSNQCQSNKFEQDESPIIIKYSDTKICKEKNRIWRESMPLNYLGKSLNSSNTSNLAFCPGDSFGDLDNTYVVVKKCFMEMYHKDKLIWSSLKTDWFGRDLEPKEGCALFLQQDGNLGFYYAEINNPGRDDEFKGLGSRWSSRTLLNPLNTELRVQDQQFQILQTFRDGTQRLFYANETEPKFKEYLGEPKKVGGSGFIKSHTDKRTTVLKRNEYIGDLDGLHLILETHCILYLKDQNHTIWSFRFFNGHKFSCSLAIEEEKWISISDQDERPSLIFNSLQDLTPCEKPKQYWPHRSSLMISHSSIVLESQFVLKNDQLFVIQTLEDGSKLTFESHPGENNGLKLQKEPRQIAKNHLTVTPDELPFYIHRMDYIGDLDGFHLILQDDCKFTLANGKDILWQLDQDDRNCMDCYIVLFSKSWGDYEELPKHCLIQNQFYKSGKLVLEDDHAIIILDSEAFDLSGKRKIGTNKYYAGPNTRGEWSESLSERSLVVVKAKDRKDLDIYGGTHLGDLNGVYARFERDCNWVLYNRSQVLWESGTSQDPRPFICRLQLKRDGALAVSYKEFIGYRDFGEEIYKKGEFWSTQDKTKNLYPSKKLLTSELSIDNNWLWLTHVYKDGTMQKFKALQGTNNFTRVETEQQAKNL